MLVLLTAASSPSSSHPVQIPFVNTTTKKHQLRLRQSKPNSNGSALLKTPEGLWDCVGCKQWTEVRYTEEGWANRYTTLYGALSEEELERIVKENEDEANITSYKKERLRNPATLTLIDMNHTELLRSADPLNTYTFVHSKWDQNDGTLELLMTHDVKTSKMSIASTEYTSMLLFFEPVQFDEDEGADNKEEPSTSGRSVESAAGFKRTRSEAF